MKIVLDTNAVLYFLGGRLTEPLPDGDFYISVITERIIVLSTVIK